MQKLKGLWIPAEILLNKDLSDKEKIILSMILYLSEEKGSCFASNKYKLKHIEEPILKFDNFNFKLCIIQELMYQDLAYRSYRAICQHGLFCYQI